MWHSLLSVPEAEMKDGHASDVAAGEPVFVDGFQ
jgi:hypothetical protein